MLHVCTWTATLKFMADITNELLDAIGRVVDTYGWAGATGERIADAAGINRTTLYRKGLTRERLIDHAITAVADTTHSAMMKSVVASGTAADRLAHMLKAVFDIADRNLGLLAGLFDGPTAVLHLSGDSPTAHFEYVEPIERLLRDGHHDGTLESIDPQRDAELIFNMALWTYVHLRRTHLQASAEIRESVTRAVIGFVTT